MVIYLDYEWALKKHTELGNEGFLDYIINLSSSLRAKDLYSFSLGWLESSEYILKFKGVNGDVIVNWK